MTIQILSIVLGLCFFIVPLWAYRLGLKDGLNIKHDKPIETIGIKVPNPFEKVKTDESNDKMTEGINNIMNYDGNPQEEVEKE